MRRLDPRPAQDLGVDVVLDHADIDRAAQAHKATGNGAGEGGGAKLVGRIDVNVLPRRGAGVAAGLVDVGIADPGLGVRIDHRHADAARHADEAGTGRHRQREQALGRTGLHDQAMAAGGVEAVGRITAAERAAEGAAQTRRTAALGVDRGVIGDEGLRVLVDGQHADRGADAHHADAERASEQENLGVVIGHHRGVTARCHVAGNRGQRVGVEHEHGDTATHAHHTTAHAHADEQDVFLGKGADRHVIERLDGRAGPDGGTRIAVHHRDVHTRCHAHHAYAQAGGERHVVEVVGSCDADGLRRIGACLVGVDVGVAADVGLRVGVDDVDRRGHGHADGAPRHGGREGIDVVLVGRRNGHAAHQRLAG